MSPTAFPDWLPLDYPDDTAIITRMRHFVGRSFMLSPLQFTEVPPGGTAPLLRTRYRTTEA